MGSYLTFRLRRVIQRKPDTDPAKLVLASLRHAELCCDVMQITLRKHWSAPHECVVHRPEFTSRLRDVLGQFRCTSGLGAVGDRQMPVHVAESIAELVSKTANHIVGCVAVRADVATVFDQSDLGVDRTEYVILR